MNLYDEAKNYEPKKTLNIADLSVVPLKEVEIEIMQGRRKPTADFPDGEEFSYKFFMYGNKEYRVPEIVIEQIQGIIENDKTVEFVTVRKSGTGMGTKYQVLPARK